MYYSKEIGKPYMSIGMINRHAFDQRQKPPQVCHIRLCHEPLIVRELKKVLADLSICPLLVLTPVTSSPLIRFGCVKVLTRILEVGPPVVLTSLDVVTYSDDGFQRVSA